MTSQHDAPRITPHPCCLRGDRRECGGDFGNNLAKLHGWRQRVADRCVDSASVGERYRWCGGVINGEILSPAAVEKGEDRRTSPRTTRPKSASPRLTRDTLCARQEALNAIGGRCTIREHPVTVARDRSASRFGPSLV